MTGGVLIANVLLVWFFFKELKLATFDPALAATLGFMPVLLHYALMTSVSVTAVVAFDAVGSILVIALMIGPPVSAYLLTDDLAHMLWLSAGIGAGSAVAGYWLAHVLDASIAGAMATMIGIVFVAVLLFAPQRGVVARTRLRERQKVDFAQTMLTIHLLNHEGTTAAFEESKLDGLEEHLRWQESFMERVVGAAKRRGLVTEQGGMLFLTDRGRSRAREAMTQTG